VPELREAQEALDALQEVSSYLKQAPFQDRRKAESALEAVHQRQEPLNRMPAFQEWLRNQEMMIQHLRQQEIDRELQRLLALYDDGVLRQTATAPAILQQITTLVPDNESVSELVQLLLASPSALGVWLQRPDIWTHSRLKWAIEIVLCRDWDRVPSTVLTQLAVHRPPPDPASRCGIALRFRIAVQEADYRHALAWSERLSRQTSLAPSLIAEGIGALAGLRQNGAKKRAWTPPFPTMIDLLDRLEYQRGTAPKP
jgi:hypothetical protein